MVSCTYGVHKFHITVNFMTLLFPQVWLFGGLLGGSKGFSHAEGGGHKDFWGSLNMEA